MWLEYTLASMKFAPFHRFDSTIKEPERYYFAALPEESLQRFTDTDCPHIETFESKRSQLKYVAMFLRSCYIESCLAGELAFHQVIQRKLHQVLQGCKFSLRDFYVRCAASRRPASPKKCGLRMNCCVDSTPN